MQLYDYQKQAVEELQLPGKHIVIAGTGAGKGSIALHWLKSTPQPKWLVVTTASKRDSHDFEKECDMWFGEEQKSQSSLTVISWQGFAKWTVAHWSELDQYAIVLDEVFKGKAGTSSAMGRAFLQVAKRTQYWAGFTATPGDRWIDFQAYFVAGGFVKNKTQFLRDFCQVQTFKGYPEIVGYNCEPVMRKWWQALTVCPDTTQMERELPKERHLTYTFSLSPDYKRFYKDRILPNGEFAETSGAYCAQLRRLCFTKQKQQWLADYLEGLGTNSVLFYALTETGDKICEIAEKALPKGAKIWRICGSIHEIPTKETLGKYDIVVCQWVAGSEAINLQMVHEWVSVEPCYSYSTSQQARGRIRRIGQEKPMVFRYLQCPDGIEGDIYQALKDKSTFAEKEWLASKK